MPPEATVAVDELQACPKCRGRLLPLSVCGSCGTVSVQHDLRRIGPQLACRECDGPCPTQFVCDACNAHFPFEKVVRSRASTGVCPSCAELVLVDAARCPSCGTEFTPEWRPQELAPVRARPHRRAAFDYDESDLEELLWIPGVNRPMAEALAKSGFNTTLKVKRASEETLAAIPGIGRKSARRITDGLWFMAVLPTRKGKEETLAEEYVCPMCGCSTSALTMYCRDCGLPFDFMEVDERARREWERNPDEALVAFYAERISRRPGDADLWYAKALVLRDLGRLENALDALDFALGINPNVHRVHLARASVLAVLGRTEDAAAEFGTVLQGFPRAAVPDVDLFAPDAPRAKPKVAEVKAAPAPRPEVHPEPEAVRPVPVKEPRVRAAPAAPRPREAVPDGARAESAALQALDALEEVAGNECPGCGQPVEAGTEICPYCSAILVEIPGGPSPPVAATGPLKVERGEVPGEPAEVPELEWLDELEALALGELSEAPGEEEAVPAAPKVPARRAPPTRPRRVRPRSAASPAFRFLEIASAFAAVLLLMFLPWVGATATAPAADAATYQRAFAYAFVGAAALLAALVLPLILEWQRAEHAALREGLDRGDDAGPDVAALRRHALLPVFAVGLLVAVMGWGVHASSWMNGTQVSLGAAMYAFALYGLPVAAALVAVLLLRLYRSPSPFSAARPGEPRPH